MNIKLVKNYNQICPDKVDVVNPVPEGGGEQSRADQALRGQVLSELSRDDDPVHRIRRQPRRRDQAEGPGQDGPLGQLDLAHVLLRQDQGRVPLTKDEAPLALHYAVSESVQFIFSRR